MSWDARGAERLQCRSLASDKRLVQRYALAEASIGGAVSELAPAVWVRF